MVKASDFNPMTWFRKRPPEPKTTEQHIAHALVSASIVEKIQSQLNPNQQKQLGHIIEIIKLVRNDVAEEIAEKLLQIDNRLSDSNPAKGIYAHAAQIALTSKSKEEQ